MAGSVNFEDKNQIEAQRSGFDLERRSKGARTKNPATLKELPDFKRSGLCSDVVEMRGVEPLSESTLTETSPGADGYFDSLGEA